MRSRFTKEFVISNRDHHRQTGITNRHNQRHEQNAGHTRTDAWNDYEIRNNIRKRRL